eukprot:2502468-Pyramimonas_sp.AAC.1
MASFNKGLYKGKFEPSASRDGDSKADLQSFVNEQLGVEVHHGVRVASTRSPSFEESHSTSLPKPSLETTGSERIQRIRRMSATHMSIVQLREAARADKRT